MKEWTLTLKAGHTISMVPWRWYQVENEHYSYWFLTINKHSQIIGGYKALNSAFRKCRHCMAVGEDMRTKVHVFVCEVDNVSD